MASTLESAQPGPKAPVSQGGDAGSNDAVEATDLAGFGYRQELHRKLGTYASFAAGFSFVSILTTVFQLFFFGFSFGGPAFFWTWPIVFCGQLLVALCFAELAARYPISGAIYQWSRRLANDVVGWFAGWIMIIAQTVTVAAAAIALQVVLPSIWTGFQVIGDDPALTSRTGAGNAVLLGSVLIVGTTVVNAIGVRLMGVINSAGVTMEILGVVALTIALFAHAERGPGVVMHTGVDDAAGAGGSFYLGAFVVSALMAAYVMVGFDSAAELSEETHDARRVAPRTILRALVASGIGGAFLLMAALVAAPSVTDGSLATGGLPYVLTERLGPVGGRIMLADVAIAVCVCTLAIQTAGSRMIFSMARDGAYPFSKQLARVSPRSGTPIAAAVVVGAGAIAVLVVNIGNASIFLALSSVCIVMLYLAYLLVTGPLLYRRLKGWPRGLPEHRTEGGGRLFSLGVWGVPVNLVAVVWGLAMMTNLAWPRASVYDPAGEGWFLQYFALIFVGASLVMGVLCYAAYRERERLRLEELAEQSAAPRHAVHLMDPHPALHVMEVEPA